MTAPSRPRARALFAVAAALCAAAAALVGRSADVVPATAAAAVLAGLVFWTAARSAAGRETEDRLRELNAILEGRVAERTRALEASEERFRAIFHSQFQFIGLMSPDGTLVEANRAALASAGVNEADVIGRAFWETAWWAHDAAQRERLKAATRRAAGGERDRFEASHPTADGGLIWVDFSLTPFRDATGAVALLIPEGRDITERKRAEAALRDGEERFRQFLDHLPLAAWATDAGGRLVLANRYLGGMLQRDAGELIGKTRLELLPDAADARAHEAADRRVRETGNELELEETYLRSDGARGTTYSVKFPVRGADGATLVGGVALDITARKRAEAALRLSEEQFRSAFEHAPIGIALVAPDGRWLRVNRSVCDIVGYSEAELLALDFQTITHPDDLQTDLHLVRRVLDGTIPTYQMEKRYIHSSGRVVHVLLSVSLVRDADGAPLHFISQIQDITERKEADERLRESRTVLALSLEAARAGVWHLDIVPRRFVPSDRALELHGLSPDAVLDHDGAMACVHPDDRERVAEALGRTLADGEPYRVEYRVAGDAREPMWLASFADVRPGPDGPRLVGLVQDVTARKRADERVRASLREKEVLLKEIHHRVKNNLQIVSTLLDLQSDYTTDPGALEMFKESRGRVKSMALIHERLYRSADVARVDFAEYVRQLADDLYRAYRVSDDDVRLELDVDVAPLPIDIAIPCGLLLNELMSNCFKHAFRGGAAGTIRVALHGDGAANALVVADDGAGFPAGVDFRNTASFGLQLVNTLVEQLGGAIELAADRGTAFTVRFAAK